MTDHSFKLEFGNPAPSSFNINEWQVREINKAVLCGQLAAGIIHDFNHVLNVIRGYSELLLEELKDNNASRDKLFQIRKAVDQGSGLAQRILALSRGDSLTPATVDINVTIEDLRRSLQYLLDGSVRLHVALSSDPCLVRIDRVQLDQVLMNLVTNACDAMPRGGDLTIRTARQNEATPYESPPTSRLDHCSVVEIADTGQGMEPGVRAHIFEPFFTTKRGKGGSGLGLANVQQILAQNGGYVQVESEPGQGSIFRVFLPSVTDIRL